MAHRKIRRYQRCYLCGEADKRDKHAPNNDLVLEELPLNVCNAFWHPKEERISADEKFKLLSVTGSIPLYLERIKPDLLAEQNIRDLCFTKGGLLEDRGCAFSNVSIFDASFI